MLRGGSGGAAAVWVWDERNEDKMVWGGWFSDIIKDVLFVFVVLALFWTWSSLWILFTLFIVIIMLLFVLLLLLLLLELLEFVLDEVEEAAEFGENVDDKIRL